MTPPPPPPHIIYLFNFDSRTELTSKEWSGIEQMSWQSLSMDNLSRWPSAHNWAVALCRGGGGGGGGGVGGGGRGGGGGGGQ